MAIKKITNKIFISIEVLMVGGLATISSFFVLIYKKMICFIIFIVCRVL